MDKVYFILLLTLLSVLFVTRLSYEKKIEVMASEFSEKEYEMKDKIQHLKFLIDVKESMIKNLRKTSPTAISLGKFKATAYDLSVQSCGKKKKHPAYGITRDGTSLVGKSRKEAMTVAVDPSVIPLGAKIYMEFTSPLQQHLTGIYTAHDTGNAVKGKHVDIYFGEEQIHACTLFGVNEVNVYMLNDKE